MESKYESYLQALVLLKKLLSDDIISLSDFNKSEAFFAKKYCIKKGSLYRSNDLINNSFRAIYMTDQKEVENDGNSCNEN